MIQGFSLDIRDRIDSTYKSLLSKWPFDKRYIWQAGFLDLDEFCRFAKEKGFFPLRKDDLYHLWNTGLISSDYVLSEVVVESESFPQSPTENVYIDARRGLDPHVTVTTNGFTKPHSISLSPLFHPFRIFELYELRRQLSPNFSWLQLITYPPGIESIASANLNQFIDGFDRGVGFDRMRSVRSTVNLAVMADPISYADTIRITSYRLGADEESLEKARQSYIRKLHKTIDSKYIRDNKDEMIKLHHSLCCDAQIIEDNREILTLSQFFDGRKRLRLKGNLGLATYLVLMAETMRRYFEIELDDRLPEEEEAGFGVWHKGARKAIYGTNRPLDEKLKAAKNFLRQLGMSSGIVLRWYVEGETEYWFLSEVLIDPTIEIINLRGNVIQSVRKGLSFRESLESDKDKEIFSFTRFRTISAIFRETAS